MSILWQQLLHTKKSGKTSYRAQIRIAKNGVIVHQESATFDTKTLAKAWSTKREAELSAQKAFKPKEKPLKISQIIQDYISQFGQNYTSPGQKLSFFKKLEA